MDLPCGRRSPITVQREGEGDRPPHIPAEPQLPFIPSKTSWAGTTLKGVSHPSRPTKHLGDCNPADITGAEKPPR